MLIFTCNSYKYLLLLSTNYRMAMHCLAHLFMFHPKAATKNPSSGYIDKREDFIFELMLSFKWL